MPITLTYSKLTSLAQDDTVLNEVEQTGPDVLTGGVNTISERKKLYCEFSVDTNDVTEEQLSLAGTKLWVSWALFHKVGGAFIPPLAAPTTGFSIVIPPSAYDADGIDMPFYSTEIHLPKPSKNYKCLFFFLTETTFALELEYYNTYDEEGYQNAEGKSLEWRFLAEHWTQQNTAEVTGSVYQEEKDIRLYTWFEQSDVPEPATFEGPIFEGQEHIIYRGQLTSYDVLSDFLLGSDTTIDIASLNTVQDTPIVARMYMAENTIDKFYAKLIRIQNNPDLDFIENYELYENEIADANVTYNVFKGPFLVTRNDIDGYYQLEFDIDYTYLVSGAKYRILIVAYDQGGVDYEGAFNRAASGPQINTTPIVSYCESNCVGTYDDPNGLEFTASLFDVNKEYTGNFLTTAIEERMRTQLIVDYSDDRWKNNVDCRLTPGGESAASNDIRYYLNGISMEIYTEYVDVPLGGIVKNVLDIKQISKTGVNTYSTNGPVFSFDTVNEILTLYYDFRNRNEDIFLALYTTLNGSGYLPVQDTQYWGGKTIFIKWTLTFFYHDFPTPFIDNLDIIQKMVVKDYSNDVVISQVGSTPFMCLEETQCYDADIIFANPELYQLINTVEIDDGNGNGTGGIAEGDAFVPLILAQQTTPVLYGQDATYAGGDARWCINPATLLVNQTYKFSAMAKKI